jgi:hypothetical protein
MDFPVTAATTTAPPPPPPASPSSGPLTAVSLTANKPAPQPANTTITFSAAPTGGAAPHQYKWLVHNGTSWAAVADWSTTSTFNWTPTAANPAHRVGIWVKSAGVAGDVPQVTNSVDFAITAATTAPPPPPPTTTTGARLTAVIVGANKIAPQPAGSTVTFTATPNGGVAPLQYKWLIHDGLYWSAVTSWTTSSTYNWTPGTQNAGYRVGVWVKSAGNTADAAEVTHSIDFPISGGSAPPPSPTPTTTTRLTAVRLTADKVAPQLPGTLVTFTAVPTGGAAPHQYKWLVHNGVSWSTVTGWSAANTFTWIPPAANSSYRVGVWVKAAGNTTDAAEVTMSMDFPIWK